MLVRFVGAGRRCFDGERPNIRKHEGWGEEVCRMIIRIRDQKTPIAECSCRWRRASWRGPALSGGPGIAAAQTSPVQPRGRQDKKPNIVFMLTDNLGYGEL